MAEPYELTAAQAVRLIRARQLTVRLSVSFGAQNTVTVPANRVTVIG